MPYERDPYQNALMANRPRNALRPVTVANGLQGMPNGLIPRPKWYSPERKPGTVEPGIYAEPTAKQKKRELLPKWYTRERGEEGIYAEPPLDLAEMIEDAGLPGIGMVKAYHGGGKFMKFSDDFMKSGTGGHVFGWGHYVSEEKGVAKYYRDLYAKEHPESVFIGGKRLRTDGDEGEAAQRIYDVMGTSIPPDQKTVISRLKREHDALWEPYQKEKAQFNIYLKDLKSDSLRKMVHDMVDAPKGALTSGKYDKQWDILNREAPGIDHNIIHDLRYEKEIVDPVHDLSLKDAIRMVSGNKKVELKSEAAHYKVKLFKGKDPSEYTFLDWDKPVPDEIRRKVGNKATSPHDAMAKKMFFGKKYSELSDVEKRIIDSKTSHRYGGESGTITGEALYKNLTTNLGSKEAASKFLERAGISGIRYPVGTMSGIKETGKKNYVIFDPKNIQIDEGPGFRRVMEGEKPVKARSAGKWTPPEHPKFTQPARGD